MHAFWISSVACMHHMIEMFRLVLKGVCWKFHHACACILHAAASTSIVNNVMHRVLACFDLVGLLLFLAIYPYATNALDPRIYADLGYFLSGSFS